VPLDLQRDKEAWPWLEVRGNSVEVGPGYYEHSEVKFDDIVLFGQYFSSSEDQSPGLFHVIITQNRIGFIPWDAPRCDQLIAALDQHWGVDLAIEDKWRNYNRKRGTDSRILWPRRYRHQALFDYTDVSHAEGILEKLMLIIGGPTWEPTLGPWANRLLAANESGHGVGECGD
jgi:hypothetical protein